MHRLRAVRRRVPGRLHLRARPRQPARPPGLAGGAVRLRLRDQLPALHPLRPVRGGLPDRGHHRVEADGVLLHQPQRRHLHQGGAAGRRRRQAQAPAVGGLARGRRPPHLGLDAGHVAGRCRRLRGPGPVVGRARLRRPRPRGRPERRARRRHHRQHAAARDPGAPPAPGRHARRQARPPGRHRPDAREGRAVPPRIRQDAQGARPTPPTSTPSGPATPSGTRSARPRRPPGPAAADADRRGRRHDRALLDVLVVAGHPADHPRRRRVRRGRRHRPGRRHRRGGGPQPGPLGPDAGHDPVRRGRAVRPPAGQLPGRRAGDRLRRRHRRALPVRDHVPRGRPRGEHRHGAAARPAAAGRGAGGPRARPASSCSARCPSGRPASPTWPGPTPAPPTST